MNESERMLVWKGEINKTFERVMNDWKMMKWKKCRNVKMYVKNCKCGRNDEMYVENGENVKMLKAVKCRKK